MKEPHSFGDHQGVRGLQCVAGDHVSRVSRFGAGAPLR